MLYNEENRSGRWYGPATAPESGELDDWQRSHSQPEAPASETEPEPPAAPYYQPRGHAPYTPAAPDKPHRRRRNIALIVCGVILLASLFFALGRACSVQVEVVNTTNPDSAGVPNPFGNFPLLPKPEELPDSADEYFQNYFTGTNDILIPSMKARSGLQLTTKPPVGDPLSLQEVYEKVNPAVVGVVAYQDGEEYSWGTGVLFTADGYLITNAHVIEGSDAAMIRFHDGGEYEAALIGSDSTTDLAVLKIDGENLPYAEFSNSNLCRVGDDVAAIGNPLGEDYSGTMTNGIISAIDRHVSNNGYDMTLLQTNAALNEGNSGGPLVNMHGQVIGITNMKIMYSYYATVEGIGFAIPSQVVREVVNQLLANGHVLGKPALGIVAGSVSAEAMEKYGMPQGVYITEVHKNSDAWAQGLRPGDVVTHVNGTAVASVPEVNALKEGLAVGDTITVEVYRKGKTFEVEFALVDSSTVG